MPMSSQQSAEAIQRRIGERMRELRTKLDMTQEAAPAASGIDYKRWQRLEAGDVNATIKTIVRVAITLSVSFEELIAT